MSIQIVHCGDLHLDKGFNIPNLARIFERKEDLNRNFSEIVEYALRNKPDLFIVSGDVFDKVSPTNSSRVFLTEKVRQLKEADIAVFLIGGNHDVPKVGQYAHLAIDILGSAGLATVYSRSDTVQKRRLKTRSGKTVCVSGKSYYAQFEGQNPLRGINIPLDGDYNILMLHGSLQGLGVVPTTPEMGNQNPFGPEDVQKGLNYLALGHFHNHFERDHFSCEICNPGSIEKLSWAEMNDEKGFYWTELSGSEISAEFIPLKTRPMELQELALSKDPSANPTDAIMEYLPKFQGSEKILRLNLRGLISQEQYAQLRMTEVYRLCRDMFFHLFIDRKDLEVEGYGRIFLGRVENPIEAFSKRLDGLIAAAGSDQARRGLLRRVKDLGTRYLEASG